MNPGRGVVEMSAYNEDTALHRDDKPGMHFVPPDEHDFRKIGDVRELQGSDYIVFVGPH
jgi:hypothetical protein